MLRNTLWKWSDCCLWYGKLLLNFIISSTGLSILFKYLVVLIICNFCLIVYSYDLLPIDKVPYNQNPSGPKGKVSLDYLATQVTTSLALYNIRSTIERFVNIFQEADVVLGAFMPKAEYLNTVDYTIHYSGGPFGILIPYPNSDIHYVTSVADPLTIEVIK